MINASSTTAPKGGYLQNARQNVTWEGMIRFLKNMKILKNIKIFEEFADF
jgi:hypothetical protein